MATLIHQYKAIKSKYPNAILLFRDGEHYEAFNEDATIIAEKMGLMIHQENIEPFNVRTELPVHSLDRALRVIVNAGHKIAVCELLETPNPKKAVKD